MVSVANAWEICFSGLLDLNKKVLNCSKCLSNPRKPTRYFQKLCVNNAKQQKLTSFTLEGSWFSQMTFSIV